jgi:general secretion pathway protein I
MSQTMKGDLRRRRALRRAVGFTLVEVLVAMTIASIALMTAIRATGSLAVNSAELRSRTMAQWSAENRLSQIRISGEWPALGRREFDCSQAGIQLTCVEQVFQTPNPAFRRVEVGVFATGSDFRLSRLIGFSVRQ